MVTFCDLTLTSIRAYYSPGSSFAELGPAAVDMVVLKYKIRTCSILTFDFTLTLTFDLA